MTPATHENHDTSSEDAIRNAILGAVTAYSALIQFGAVVDGTERAMLYGAAKAKRTGTADETLAWQIADFLPIALARPGLQAMGIKLDQNYARLDSKGQLRTYRPLQQEPVFRVAVMMVSELQSQHGATVGEIVKLSVEHQMIHSALARGSQPCNLDLGPPVLNGPDELCDPYPERPRFDPDPWWLAAIQKQRRPWWKFW